jgi:mono/diheme cytochrome c family protein
LQRIALEVLRFPRVCRPKSVVTYVTASVEETRYRVVERGPSPALSEELMKKALVRTGKFMLLAAAVLAFTTVPARAQSGAEVYKSKCAMCHGADGKGDTPVGKSMKLRDLGSADVQKQSDTELIAITADGKGRMPGYKGKLTDDQIKEVVSYIRTFKK